VNIHLVAHLLGRSLVFLGLTMVFPLFWAVYYQGPDRAALLSSALITLASGVAVALLVPPRGDIRYREGFAIVTFGWLLVSLYGALPTCCAGSAAVFRMPFLSRCPGLPQQGQAS
jgi:trk system potassium uptake protein TrkH